MILNVVNLLIVGVYLYVYLKVNVFVVDNVDLLFNIVY